MQIANALVAIDGHTKVPKYGVTAAEIAVLRAIHGPESVSDIEPAGDVERSNPEELARLNDLYRGARDEDNQPILRGVYPVASAVHTKLGDLDLPSEMFRAKTRVGATDKPTKAAKDEADAKKAENSSPDDVGEPAPKPSNAEKTKPSKTDAFA